jgi:predicted enzyme related to lactoylglutathione lyase
MKVSHIHLSFLDLKNAIGWMKQVLNKEPSYQNEGMAVFSFENIDYVFDQGEVDTEITIAFASANCEDDFQKLNEHGAEVVELPTTQPWGVKTAYLKGPGKLTFEVEESLR